MNTITQLDPNTIEITTPGTTVQVPLADYKATLTQQIADLTAARDSYQPLIDDIQKTLAGL